MTRVKLLKCQSDDPAAATPTAHCNLFRRIYLSAIFNAISGDLHIIFVDKKKWRGLNVSWCCSTIDEDSGKELKISDKQFCLPCFCDRMTSPLSSNLLAAFGTTLLNIVSKIWQSFQVSLFLGSLVQTKVRVVLTAKSSSAASGDSRKQGK